MMRSQQHPDSLQPISHACNSKLKAAVATTVFHVMNYSSPPQNKCVIYYVCFRRCHSRARSSVSETVWPARHGHIFQVKPALQSFIPLLLTSNRGHIGPSQDTHTIYSHTHFGASNQANVHVFEVWEETVVPGENHQPAASLCSN